MDKTTFSQISRAAQKLYDSCVARDNQRSEGGWIKDLGRLYQFVSSFCFVNPAFVRQSLLHLF